MSDIQETESFSSIQVKVSRLAIAAISLAFCGLILVSVRLFGSDPRIQVHLKLLVKFYFLLVLVCLFLPLLLELSVLF